MPPLLCLSQRSIEKFFIADLCLFFWPLAVYSWWRLLRLLCCVYLGSREYRLLDLARDIPLAWEKGALASPVWDVSWTLLGELAKMVKSEQPQKGSQVSKTNQNDQWNESSPWNHEAATPVFFSDGFFPGTISVSCNPNSLSFRIVSCNQNSLSFRIVSLHTPFHLFLHSLPHCLPLRARFLGVLVSSLLGRRIWNPRPVLGRLTGLLRGAYSRSSQPQNQQNHGVVKLWINFFEPSELWNFKLGDSSLFPLQVFNGRTMQNRLLYGH